MKCLFNVPQYTCYCLSVRACFTFSLYAPRTWVWPESETPPTSFICRGCDCRTRQAAGCCHDDAAGCVLRWPELGCPAGRRWWEGPATSCHSCCTYSCVPALRAVWLGRTGWSVQECLVALALVYSQTPPTDGSVRSLDRILSLLWGEVKVIL